jgi:hypothetical protein
MRIKSTGEILHTLPSEDTTFAAGTDSTWNRFEIFQDRGAADTASGIAFRSQSGTAPAGIVSVALNTTGGREELAFITSAGNASSEVMRLDENGNVGIGTSSPTDTDGFGKALDVSSSTGAALYLRDAGDSTLAAIGMFNTNLSINSKASSGNIIFYSNDSEKARIDGNGNVLVGLTSDNFLVADAGVQIKPSGFIRIGTDGTSAATIMSFINNTDGTPAQVGAITTSGSSTTYATSSDYRLKENVVYDWDATTRLKKLKPARFNFIADAETTVDGFIAHEVQSVVPEAITGTHNEVDADGNPVYQGIDQSKLVGLLVKTIQELEARITALEGA